MPSQVISRSDNRGSVLIDVPAGRFSLQDVDSGPVVVVSAAALRRELDEHPVHELRGRKSRCGVWVWFAPFPHVV